MNTNNVTRVEVIDHSKPKDSDDYGVAYNFWHEYRDEDIPNPNVRLELQDDGRTLKVFITAPLQEEE